MPETADAVKPGLVTARTLMLLNGLADAATSFEAWIGEGAIEIDLGAHGKRTTRGAGSVGAARAPKRGSWGGQHSGKRREPVYIRRTIGADTAPSQRDLEVRYSFGEQRGLSGSDSQAVPY